MGQNFDIQRGNKHKLIKKDNNIIYNFKTFKENSNIISVNTKYSDNSNTIKKKELSIQGNVNIEPYKDNKTNIDNKNIEYKIDDKKLSNLNENKVKANKSSIDIDSNFGESERDESKFSKYRHYLNFLYKNNFLSLSFDELSAYLIQYHWRKYYIKELKKLYTGLIEIIYKNELDFSIFNLLNKRKYTFKCYDISFYRNLKKILEKIGVIENNLPIFFVNGYYLGDFTKFNYLINDEIFEKIYGKEYDRVCLNCGDRRENKNNEVCNKCGKKYIFFSVNNKIFNLWDERYEDYNKK